MQIHTVIAQVALERGLRDSTYRSYKTLLERAFRSTGGLEREVPTQAECFEALMAIHNINTRRSTAIAMRSAFGYKIRVPKGVARVYDLPDEDSLRLALMLSPHEGRGLLIMYGGLRIGEACAVTDFSNPLLVDKQYTDDGKYAPPKSSSGYVYFPSWLDVSFEKPVKPSVVRESLRRAGMKVGIPLSTNMLRHWYATESLKRGMPIVALSKQMRHSDPAITLRAYAQSTTQDIRNAWG